LAYEARVILVTSSGQTIGAGEAICSSNERNWASRDEFALKSMAQTRATGKAARTGFSWIMSLAGFEVTPAEEMVADPIQDAPPPTIQPWGSPPPRTPQTGRKITDPQRKRFYAIAKKAGASDDEIKGYLKIKIGSEHTRDITMDQYDDLCNNFQAGANQ